MLHDILSRITVNVNLLIQTDGIKSQGDFELDRSMPGLPVGANYSTYDIAAFQNGRSLKRHLIRKISS